MSFGLYILYTKWLQMSSIFNKFVRNFLEHKCCQILPHDHGGTGEAVGLRFCRKDRQACVVLSQFFGACDFCDDLPHG